MEDILIKLLILDGNETNYIERDEVYTLFKDLILNIVKVEKNIRFCSNANCPCHPETSIKRLLKDKELRVFLNDWCKGVVEDLEILCENYIPVVSRAIYED